MYNNSCDAWFVVCILTSHLRVIGDSTWSHVSITDKALAWLRSYIRKWYQKVLGGSVESGGLVLVCGVRQGSLLGPILYCMYTRPIGRIIARHGMNHHRYADNLQIYPTVDHDESIVAALAKLELCVAEVAAWPTNNKLRHGVIRGDHVLLGKEMQHPACWFAHYSSRPSNSNVIVDALFGCDIWL